MNISVYVLHEAAKLTVVPSGQDTGLPTTNTKNKTSTGEMTGNTKKQ